MDALYRYTYTEKKNKEERKVVEKEFFYVFLAAKVGVIAWSKKGYSSTAKKT